MQQNNKKISQLNCLIDLETYPGFSSEVCQGIEVGMEFIKQCFESDLLNKAPRPDGFQVVFYQHQWKL